MTHDFIRSSLNLILTYRENNYEDWTNKDTELLERLIRYRARIMSPKESVTFNIERSKVISKFFNSKQSDDAKFVLLYDGYLRNSESYTKSVLLGQN